jgi:transcription antitermination factor NusG
MGACNQIWPWFAVQVRTSTEATAVNLLQNKGYECYLPLAKSRRHWSDRMKILERPLFPGYLFCRFDVHNRLPILKTPGVLQIVGVGKTPVPVDEMEMNAIQKLGESGLQAHPWPFLQIGDLARIASGPLRGLTGIVVGMRSELKLVLSVSLLQRSVAVEVERDWLEVARSASRTTHAAWQETAPRCHQGFDA